MNDFEMLATLMKKVNADISNWIAFEDEEEIEVFLGEEGDYGFSFFFDKKTGMITH